MRLIRVLAGLAILLLPLRPLIASCGSSSCPLDLNALNNPIVGQVGLDLSWQYLNQDQPMIGTHSASVGQIPSDHSEVDTVNRVLTGVLAYAPTKNLQLSGVVPWVSRSHLHLAADGSRETWDIHGLGDIAIQARYRFLAIGHGTGAGLWLIGGIKLPTGSHDRMNAEGEVAELPIQPGSGTTDGIFGLAWQGGSTRSVAFGGSMGNYAVVPFFASATYQARSGGVDGYRIGNELQANAGGAYPVTREFAALFQVNGRFRAKDHGPDPAETDFTGGTHIYISPGVRLDTRGIGVYAILQIPVYQQVNELQLTSRANLVVGVQHRFR